MEHGVLEDEYDEFFIIKDNRSESISNKEKGIDKEVINQNNTQIELTSSVSGGLFNYWADRYHLREDNIPSFLDVGLVLFYLFLFLFLFFFI
jgi:hypothetical protein